MLNLLKHEFFKFFHSFGFKLLIILTAGIFLFLSGIQAIFISALDIPLEEMGTFLIISGRYAMYAAFGDFSNISIIIAVIASMTVVREFQQGTIKNTVMYNQSKLNIYIAKYILQIAAITATLTVYALPYILTYNIFGGWGEAFTLQSLWADYIRLYLMGLFMGYAFAAFANFFAYLTKNTALVIVIVYVLLTILSLLPLLVEVLPMFSFITDLNFLWALSNYYAAPTLANFLIFLASAALLFIPFSIAGYYVFKQAEFK